jgi:hypothetical protein
MLLTYELYDKEGEPLMDLKGKEYIAPIGSNVIFSDYAADSKEAVSIEFVGKVISHQYNIELDTLCIDCEINQILTEHDDLRFVKYHELKFKQSC